MRFSELLPEEQEPYGETIEQFAQWLRQTGRGYLLAGLDGLTDGRALLEIYRRAGIAEFCGDSVVLETLGRARQLIEGLCPGSDDHLGRMLH